MNTKADIPIQAQHENRYAEEATGRPKELLFVIGVLANLTGHKPR